MSECVANMRSHVRLQVCARAGFGGRGLRFRSIAKACARPLQNGSMCLSTEWHVLVN